jgi:hypothetical protein
LAKSARGDIIQIEEETTAAGRSDYARLVRADDVTPEITSAIETPPAP